jgi:hypothetical protein
MHPGGQPGLGWVKEGVLPWRSGVHKRKFIASEGKFISENGDCSDGKFAFWGELESPTSFIKTNLNSPYPFAVHTPLKSNFPKGGQGLLGTDPNVFGNFFTYSNCKQDSCKSLKELEEWSILLFGSQVNEKFCLDTCFVVDKSFNWAISDSCSVFNDPFYNEVTFKPMHANTNSCSKNKSCSPGNEYVAYKAKMFSESQNELYSFVPCKKVNDDLNSYCFKRPIIDLGEINHFSGRNIKITKSNKENVLGIWKNVVKQIRAQNLLLGVYAKTP